MGRGIIPIKQFPIGHDLKAVKAMFEGQNLDLTTVGTEDDVPADVLEYAIKKVAKKDKKDCDVQLMTRCLKQVFRKNNITKMGSLKCADVDKFERKIKERYEEMELLDLIN